MGGVLDVEFDGRELEHKLMITKDSVSLKELTVELSDLSEELKSLLEKCWAVSESEDFRIIITRSRECWGHSVQVSVLQEPVLECKTFLLPLAPFLVVKIDVSALKEIIRDSCSAYYNVILTCSNSSLIILGSSCLWNHIMYLV